MKTKRGLCRIGCSAIIMMAASFATAQVGYVKPGGSGTNDGSSWANAYPGVATALANASSAGYTELWVEQGTYTVLESAVPSGLEMYGGFDGTETVRADRDWAANTTTLESDGSTRVLNMTTNSVVDGFTITGGDAAGATETPHHGGAVWMHNTPGATLRNCTLTGNQAQFGGALYVRGFIADNTNPELIENCVFENNSVNVANGAGSAVFLMALAYTEFTGCTFTNNSSALATPVSRGNGAVDGQTWSVGTMHPKFHDSVFDSNSSGGSGGAINLYSNNADADIRVTIDGCTFTSNSAVTDGGAVYLRGPGLKTITNSTFIGNESDSNNSGETANDGYGGAIMVLPFTNPAQVNIVNSVFAKNESHGFGSAIYMNNDAANGHIINNTFDGNTAKFEDANVIAMLDIRPGTELTITNNIFSNSSGRGVSRITGASVEPLMLHNLFHGNASWDFNNGADGGTMASGINSVGSNAGNKSGNPNYVDSAGNDFSLSAESAAVASAHADSAPATDIEGTARPLPAGTAPDIGAYEETTATEPVDLGIVAYVTVSGAGAQNGSDWANAYAGVANALSDISGGTAPESYNNMWVAQGTYTVIDAIMPNGLKMYGGFAGSEVELSGRDWASNTTTLQSDGSSRVIQMSPDSRLDGFTITGGDAATATNHSGYGGGVAMMFASGSVLENCTVTGNSAGVGGGVMVRNNVVDNPNPERIINCVIDGNTMNVADGEGAGLALWTNVYTIIEDTTFSNNTMTALAGFNVAGGGAVAKTWSAGPGHPKFYRCTFVDNYASADGGGLGVRMIEPGEPVAGLRMDVTLEDCVFEGNTADGRGGGLYVRGLGTATITRTMFLGNLADGDPLGTGGAYYTQDNVSHVVNSLFANNRAQNHGGAIEMFNHGGGYFINNTFYGNYCIKVNNYGGAIDIKDGPTFDLINNLFVNNDDWAINEYDESSTDPILTNNMFDSNAQGDYYNFGDTPTGSLSMAELNSLGSNSGNFQGNALLQDPGNGLFEPYSNSDAVNAGVTGANVPSDDILGRARDGAPDVGAYESFLATTVMDWQLF